MHFGRLSGSFWTVFWCRGRLFADTLADPLAGKPASENLRRSPPIWHRAECGGCHLGSARCPGGTQSACEGNVPNLNLVLHFSVPHFCTTLFTPCTYFSALHFTSCSHFFQYLTSALPALPCIYFSALHFLHLLDLHPLFQRFPP